MASTVLTPEEDRLFKQFISKRSGLYFKEHGMHSLEEAVTQRMQKNNIPTPADYYQLLVTSHKKEIEIRELFNLLTVKHTFFFRNKAHFESLEKVIFPEIIKQKMKKGKKIKVWSAGCSSGEEPFSIAMMIHNNFPFLALPGPWRLTILGTDASTAMLSQAQEAVYKKESFKTMPEKYLMYFVQEGERYRLREEIKNMVQFGYLNLVGDNYPFDCDIILCRNVTIYFDKKTTQKVITRIYYSLDDNGYLIIGHSENLKALSGKFKMVAMGDTILYRKKAIIPDAAVLRTLKKKEMTKYSIIENTSAPHEGRQSRQEEETGVADQSIDVQAQMTWDNTGIFEQYKKAEKLYREKDYAESLGYLKRLLKTDVSLEYTHILIGKIYVRLGNYAQAEAAYQNALRLNPLSPDTHYLLGLLYKEQTQYEPAITEFKRAIYLDMNHAIAHFHLAETYSKTGKDQQASREYRNTLKTLKQADRGKEVDHTEGFNYNIVYDISCKKIDEIEDKQGKKRRSGRI